MKTNIDYVERICDEHTNLGKVRCYYKSGRKRDFMFPFHPDTVDDFMRSRKPKVEIIQGTRIETYK